jgi:hypothetical protein
MTILSLYPRRNVGPEGALRPCRGFLRLVLLAGFCTPDSPAAPFVNLTLDDPDIAALVPAPHPQPGVLQGPASDVLPGWVYERGGIVNPVIWYSGGDYVPGITTTLNLSTHDFPGGGRPGHLLFLSTGLRFDIERTVSLSQTGTIPIDADQLSLFVGNTISFSVSVNGLSLGLVPDPERFRYYDVDVSPWKGEAVNLELKLEASPFNGATPLDILGFKTVIPEPGAGTLLLAGAGCVWFARRRGVGCAAAGKQ